jgi:sialic acid synthase SpsE
LIKPIIIAEIGSNIFKYSDLDEIFDNACRQIEVAKQCGASAVKFQMFTAQELYGPQVSNSKLEQEVNRNALHREMVPMLFEYANDVGIEFMCSAFSIDGYDFLEPYVKSHKIASPEAVSKELVDYVFSTDKRAIVSNGCLTRQEQDMLVSDISKWGADDILMECVSRYPATTSHYDLIGMSKYAKVYDLLWGLSDHTLGVATAVIARRLGAVCFEKHVDLVPGGSKTPDKCVSMDVSGFSLYCEKIKEQDNIDLWDTKLKSRVLYARRSNGYRPVNE